MTTLLSFSVGMHITIVVINVALGLAAIALTTKSLRFPKLRGEVSSHPERTEVGDGVAGPPAL